MLESTIERKYVRWCRTCGVIALKLNPNWYKSIPDRIVVIPGGMCFFLEFKRPGEKPRKGQYKRMRQMRRMGFKVFWADNLEDAIQITEDFVKKCSS